MDLLKAYWSGPELVANGLLVFHFLGAAILGMVLGYERSYHGRAAGIRTYALVCVASTMLTVICGFPGQWYGGLVQTPAAADPTRVIQGIMTGIGFLGAGVIMKEGFTIRGLSTAASIWMAAAIGVVIGIGFFGAAIVATLITVVIMGGFRRLELALPHQILLHVSLVYARNHAPSAEEIRGRMKVHGFDISHWGFQLSEEGHNFEYDLVLQASTAYSVNDLVTDLTQAEGLNEFRLAPSRD
jgi:putative Mg2+ transporter-C (MgtC) family protein